MKIIHTANYKKTSQMLLTPETEDAYADQQANISKKRRELDIVPGNKSRFPDKRTIRDGLQQGSTNLSDGDWKDLIRRKINETNDSQGDEIPF